MKLRCLRRLTSHGLLDSVNPAAARRGNSPQREPLNFGPFRLVERCQTWNLRRPAINPLYQLYPAGQGNIPVDVL